METIQSEETFTCVKKQKIFLCDILTEITNLQGNGISYREEVFEVKINAFICDAPARAF